MALVELYNIAFDMSARFVVLLEVSLNSRQPYSPSLYIFCFFSFFSLQPLSTTPFSSLFLHVPQPAIFSRFAYPACLFLLTQLVHCLDQALFSPLS